MAGEIVTPRRSVDEDESIGEFVGRRFGREAVDYLADPLLAGIHAGDVDRLSIRALFPRLVDAERRSGSVIRALRALRVRPSPQGAFVSLPGGLGELADTLAAALAPGTVILSARATTVRRSDTYSVESTAGHLLARSVVLAVPAYVTASLLRPMDPTLADLCDGVPYASTATVAFGYRRDQVAHPLRGTGFVVPRTEGIALLAGTWVSSKWPGPCPRWPRSPERVSRGRPRSAASRCSRSRAHRNGGAGAHRDPRHLGIAALHAALPVDTPEPSIRSGSSATNRADRSASDVVARRLRDGQRLPCHRDPGLHQRWARHGASRRRVSRFASIRTLNSQRSNAQRPTPKNIVT